METQGGNHWEELPTVDQKQATPKKRTWLKNNNTTVPGMVFQLSNDFKSHCAPKLEFLVLDRGH